MENRTPLIEGEHGLRKVRQMLPGIVAILTSVFLLCILPLYFDDAFFNINRAKVSLVLFWMPFLAIAMGLALLIMTRKGDSYSGYPILLLVPAICYGAAAIISSALQGFSDAVLTGNEGRYGGLYLILCMIAGFLILALGRLRGRISTGIFLGTGVLVAALGCANAMGLDPLHFYVEIREDQIDMFYSTIGHYDFYGCYLLLPAAVAYGLAIKSDKWGVRVPSVLCAIVMTVGAFVSRTDSVLLGFVVIAFGMFFLSGESFRQMTRALMLTGLMILLLPLTVYVLKNYSPRALAFDGAYNLVTVQNGIEGFAVFAILAIICRFVGAQKEVFGFRRLAILGLIILVILSLVLCGLVVYLTANPEAKLFGLEAHLRIDEDFGSRRGYIWPRALHAYLDGTLVQKLFGHGVELTKQITRPYIEDPAEELLGGGVYNDAHCQPLQILLTMGLFGTVAFLAHYFILFFVTCKYSENDVLGTALALAQTGYFVVMMINVMQPILILSYFAVSGLAVSHIAWRKQQPETRQ